MNGYWRVPNWYGQAFFGVKVLRNYGFEAVGDKATIQILEGSSGVLARGKVIRENYRPITGGGGEALNFSRSAPHFRRIRKYEFIKNAQ